MRVQTTVLYLGKRDYQVGAHTNNGKVTHLVYEMLNGSEPALPLIH